MDANGQRWDRGGEDHFLPESVYWQTVDSLRLTEYGDSNNDCASASTSMGHAAHQHKRNLIRFTPFPLLGTLPNELLLYIFAYLDAPDLACVAQTCWTFYNMSIKELLRHLHWNPHSRSVFNSTIWINKKSDLDRIPVSLVLVGQHSRTFEVLYERYQAFTGLRDIQFWSFDLSGSPTVYETLKIFPSLRKLSFVKCTMPPCAPEVAQSFVDLPIEELGITFTSWDHVTGAAAPQHHQLHVQQAQQAVLHQPANNPQALFHHLPMYHGGAQVHNILFGPNGLGHGPHFQPTPFGHVPANLHGGNGNANPPAVATNINNHLTLFQALHPIQVPPAPMVAAFPLPPGAARRYGALNLASARNLKILRLDWTDAVAAYVFDDTMMKNPIHIAKLHTLELRGLDEGKVTGGSVHDYLHATARLLRGCSGRLERLGLMPDVRLKRLPWIPAMDTLHTFHGPLETVKLFKIHDTIKHIVAVNEVNPTRLAPCLPSRLKSLESIELKLPHWDIEMLHCAVQVFPTVRDLRIKYYGTTDPDAQTFMSFPYEFLPLLPNLQVFHLYGINQSKQKIFGDDFRLIRMSKNLGKLMEVRLQAAAVWRRATLEDNDWSLRLDRDDSTPLEDQY